MLRSFALHDIPIDHIASMERWYHRDHAPEIVRRYGPWLTRFECYLPVHAPVDAQAYGFFNWRMTEGWWRELPEAGCDADPYFTPPMVWPRVAACFVTPQPTEDFVAAGYLPLEKVALRWLVLLRYPRDVSFDEGEEWFLRVHAPEAAGLPGLLRFFSWKVLGDVGGVPGRWRPDTAPPAGQAQTSWDRAFELWFESFADWRRWVAAASAECTKPAWRTRDDYPFVAPFEDFAGTFILERPNDDFLRDMRGYVP